jgi:hypothetical protein
MDQATNTLSANRLVRYIGIDRSGFTRVWGQAETSEEAWDQCYLAAIEYVRRRPDTAPCEEWMFKEVE